MIRPWILRSRTLDVSGAARRGGGGGLPGWLQPDQGLDAVARNVEVLHSAAKSKVGVRGRLNLAAEYIAVGRKEHMPGRIIFLEAGHRQNLGLDLIVDFGQPSATWERKLAAKSDSEIGRTVFPQRLAGSIISPAPECFEVSIGIFCRERSLTKSSTCLSPITRRIGIGSPRLGLYLDLVLKLAFCPPPNQR